MYDVYTFFGFVAIVLSPCLVALAARARQDREDRRTGARRPEAFGARSKHSRVTSIKAVDSSVSSVARRPVLLPVYANRPREFREFRESREIVQAAPPRSKRSNGPSIFIRPVQRLTAAQALRARHAKKLAAAELARRRSRATSECIRPVRRVLPIPRSMPKVKLAWCARSY